MKAVEVPTVPGRDGEIELDLGLSIGGSFRKLPEKPVLVERGGGGREVTSTSGSSLTLASDGDESAVVDPKGRGEIQAARRREAKRKREEKRLRRGRSFAGGGEEEEEEEEGRRPLKKEMRNVDLNLSDDQVDNRDHPKRDPAVQVSYPFSPLHYVPFINGYAIPCVMPYWAAGAAIGHGGELHQPVACRSFRQFPTNQNAADVSLSNGCQMEQQNGSSSSVISDNYQTSSSHEGGGSSNTKSNSSNSSSDQHQMMSSKPCSDNRTQCSEKFCQSHHVSKSSSTTTTGIKKEAIVASSKDEVLPSSKPVSNPIKSSPPPMAHKVVKTENGKPPKPQTQSRSNIPSLQDMPCVSTTGVGPNGKTVTGFLYTYSNLEVSILCVCHGEFFSPAEFVKHAGGAEVSHPLRHITVLSTNAAPSATR